MQSVGPGGFCFSPTSGKLLGLKICFPHILDFPEGISKDKIVIFIFFNKKNDFRASFLIFTSSVQWWSLDQPQVPGVLVNKTFTQKISIFSNPNIVYVLKILSEEELLHF